MTPLHMGALHPVEQVLTLLLAFGPFVVLGIVVAVRRRQDRAPVVEVRGAPAPSLETRRVEVRGAPAPSLETSGGVSEPGTPDRPGSPPSARS